MCDVRDGSHGLLPCLIYKGKLVRFEYTQSPPLIIGSELTSLTSLLIDFILNGFEVFL